MKWKTRRSVNVFIDCFFMDKLDHISLFSKKNNVNTLTELDIIATDYFYLCQW